MAKKVEYMSSGDAVLILALCLSIFTNAYFAYQFYLEEEHYIPREITYNQWNTEPFDLLSEFAASKEYLEGQYDCINFSNDALAMLEEHGYYGDLICGCEEFANESMYCHQWINICFNVINYKYPQYEESTEVCVDIEPQTARIVNYDENNISCDPVEYYKNG